MQVEVAYANSQEQALLKVEVAAGTTAEQAVLQSGILTQFQEIDWSSCNIGIFSEPIAKDQLLQEGDRVEIYRPLKIDPKEARRLRAAKTAEAKINEDR